MNILGLTGKKGHGKDELAKILAKENDQFRRIAFADELKRICCVVFGITRKQVTDPEEKERALPYPIELDKQLDALKRETKLDLKPLGMVARTPRQVLQFVGTDYVRSIQDSYWVDVVVKQMQSDPKAWYIVTDLRFINEAEQIRSLGGIVLRVLRLAKRDSAVPEHASEELNFDPDYTLGVMENNWSVPRWLAKETKQGWNWVNVRLNDLDWNRRHSWDHDVDDSKLRQLVEFYRLFYYGENT